MRYGQTVVVNRAGHPLYSRRGLVYRVLSNRVTVLFDKEILYDFTEDELVVSEQGNSNATTSLMNALE